MEYYLRSVHFEKHNSLSVIIQQNLIVVTGGTRPAATRARSHLDHAVKLKILALAIFAGYDKQEITQTPYFSFIVNLFFLNNLFQCKSPLKVLFRIKH